MTGFGFTGKYYMKKVGREIGHDFLNIIFGWTVGFGGGGGDLEITFRWFFGGYFFFLLGTNIFDIGRSKEPQILRPNRLPPSPLPPPKSTLLVSHFFFKILLSFRDIRYTTALLWRSPLMCMRVNVPYQSNKVGFATKLVRSGNWPYTWNASSKTMLIINWSLCYKKLHIILN